MKKLNEALIVLDADVETAEDCIRLAGEMFEKNGYVNAGYADAVVEREKEYPTGLPGKGINIAIPHTNNKLVNEPAVGVIIPKKAVTFSMMGMKENKLECEVILPLVVKDSHQQIGMLKKMMSIIQDGELLKRLRDQKCRSYFRFCGWTDVCRDKKYCSCTCGCKTGSMEKRICE